MPIVVVEKGHLRGRRFVLPERGMIRVGRDKTCQLQLRDLLASRFHCILRGEAGTWALEDLKSSNGTFVNGVSVARHTLAPGDLIQVGETVFSFLASQEDPWIGKTMAGYRIETRLGRGGMGTVYRARQLSLDRGVALKILRDSLAEDPDFVARFLQEARAAARLNHPNVVQIYDAGSAEATHYIAMEYIPGGTLEEAILAAGPIDYREAASMGCDALKALAFAEEKGIVHRDIKPGNLLLTRDRSVKICDLGIALDLRQPSKQWAHTVAGSPVYMAPEQVRGEAVDHRADLYALGATLYHAIAGVPPYEQRTVKGILRSKLTTDPAPLGERVPKLPPPLAEAVTRMMARCPADRFSSAVEAEEAIKEALSTPQRMPVAPPVRPKLPSRLSPVNLAAGIGLIIGVLVLVLSFALNRSGGTEGDRLDTHEGVNEVFPQPGDRGEAGDCTARGKEYLAAAGARIDRLLEDGDLPGAAREIEACAFRFGPSAPVAGWEERLKAQVGDLLATYAARVAYHCEKARFQEAEGEVEKLLAKLPERDRERVEAIRSSIGKAQRSHEESLRELEALEPRVFTRLAHLDLPEATTILEEFSAKKPHLGDPFKALRTEVEDAGRVWRAITSAFQDHAKNGTTIALTLGPDPLGGTPAGRYRVTGLTAHRLDLELVEGTRRKEVRSVLELPADTLLAVLSSQGSVNPEVAKAGLGLLLLLRRGIEPSTPLLLAQVLPPSVLKTNERRAGAYGELWRSIRLQEATALYDEARRAGKRSPELLGYLAREAAGVLLGWPDAEARAQAIPGLQALYLGARAGSLLAGPAEGCFHAKTVKQYSGGIMELVYDFSTPDQCEDFFPLDTTDSQRRQRKEQPALELSGEVRYLRGDPFEEYVAVKGVVADCVPGSANVNVAFWTSPEDSVSLKVRQFDAKTWLSRLNQQVRAEYLVCGMGYRLAFDQSGVKDGGENPFQGVARGDVPPYVGEPVLAIMAGAHGQDLGWAPGQLLWSAPAGDTLKAPLTFVIELRRGTLRWNLQDRPVPFKEAAAAPSSLKDTLSPQGSFSFLTNGSTVALASLQVQAKLRPDWLAKEADRRARLEWTNLLAATEGARWR